MTSVSTKKPVLPSSSLCYLNDDNRGPVQVKSQPLSQLSSRSHFDSYSYALGLPSQWSYRGHQPVYGSCCFREMLHGHLDGNGWPMAWLWYLLPCFLHGWRWSDGSKHCLCLLRRMTGRSLWWFRPFSFQFGAWVGSTLGGTRDNCGLSVKVCWESRHLHQATWQRHETNQHNLEYVSCWEDHEKSLYLRLMKEKRKLETDSSDREGYTSSTHSQ